MRHLLFFFTIIVLTSCSAYKGKLLQKAGYVQAGNARVNLAAAPTDSVQFTYFECGGICIKTRNDVILIDPFASNPSIVSKVKTNPKAIKLMMSGVNRAGVEAILISHSHYDHLMDVPEVMKNYCPPTTKLFANQTGVQIAKRLGVDTTQLLNVEKSTGFVQVSKTMRVLPLISSHPPHIGNKKLFDGEYRPNTKPASKSFWRCGKPYAYLIDFMKGPEVTFRVMVQTSASNEASTNLPDSLLKVKGVDVMVMAAALYSKTSGYPSSVLNRVNPKYSIVGHWENFFKPYAKLTAKPYVVAGGTDIMTFAKLMEQAVGKDKFRLPMPGSSITFRY